MILAGLMYVDDLVLCHEKLMVGNFVEICRREKCRVLKAWRRHMIGLIGKEYVWY